ncbi:ECM18 (YDR125C) and ICT1 (YLR099C) [Zygosaccharomyces parabailii]|nr:ECM18 (YDR125C) and ICT1 (YLR099C) [Zygosaccharomyces parabailii]
MLGSWRTSIFYKGFATASFVRASGGSIGRRIAWRLVASGQDRIVRKKAKGAFRMWITDWMNQKDVTSELKEFQDEIMSHVKVVGSKEDTMIGGVLNQWHFHNPAAAVVKTPTLLIHGYAASSMAYYRTFEGLNRQIRDLYAIDLPSNGLSKELPLKLEGGEPVHLKVEVSKGDNKFKITQTIDAEHCKSVVKQYEDYYLDSIEYWRKQNGIEKFNLVGHSFGGYIAFKYSVKYPNSVKQLGLISPLGIESNMYSVNNNWTIDNSYEMDLTDPSSNLYGKHWEVPKFIFERQTELLRWMGPLGAKLCWNYVSNAYSKLPTMEYKNYVFELLYGKGGIPRTARKVFTGLFTRNLLARDPIMDSIDQLGAEKLLLLYGDHDWMNNYAGYRMVEILNDRRQSKYASYAEIPNAGHNLFLDNPNSFNDSLIDFLAE